MATNHLHSQGNSNPGIVDMHFEAVQGAFNSLNSMERQRVLSLFADWSAESEADGFVRVAGFAGTVRQALVGLTADEDGPTIGA
jgi:hypothetical protein